VPVVCSCDKSFRGCKNAEKKSIKDMVQTMVRAKYDSDPVKAWKEAQKKMMVSETGSVWWKSAVLLRVICSRD